MIVLFTDFGPAGPYTGQMKAVLRRQAPEADIIDLFSDAPAFDAKLSAYLLAAYVDEFPDETVFLCVVDPGVGGDRPAGILRCDGRWFVGPGNGLFEPLIRRSGNDNPPRWHDITRRPKRLSATFHGRDLFAPVAARLARGDGTGCPQTSMDCIRRPDWPDDLAQIVYFDKFGNALTGVRAAVLAENTIMAAGEKRLIKAKTFSDVPPGEAIWYENSNGLAEIAVNEGSAREIFGLELGDAVVIEPPPAS
jgi:S-adenosylmethionine hydrolase